MVRDESAADHNGSTNEGLPNATFGRDANHTAILLFDAPPCEYLVLVTEEPNTPPWSQAHRGC
jgi:hypothetical protein